jgi:multidrug efflux pump subunit AcrA (membrane-fusion protein)
LKLGLSLGLNAVNQIGNDMRDYRQETEIRDTRAQLQSSQMRETELEARLRALEQANQNNQLNAQQQQQLMQIESMMKQMQAPVAK